MKFRCRLLIGILLCMCLFGCSAEKKADSIDVLYLPLDEALSVLEEAGYTGISVNRPSGRLKDDECIVTDLKFTDAHPVLTCEKLIRISLKVQMSESSDPDAEIRFYLDDREVGTAAFGSLMAGSINAAKGMHSFKAEEISSSKTCSWDFSISDDTVYTITLNGENGDVSFEEIAENSRPPEHDHGSGSGIRPQEEEPAEESGLQEIIIDGIWSMQLADTWTVHENSAVPKDQEGTAEITWAVIDYPVFTEDFEQQYKQVFFTMDTGWTLIESVPCDINGIRMMHFASSIYGPEYSQTNRYEFVFFSSETGHLISIRFVFAGEMPSELYGEYIQAVHSISLQQ